MKLEEAESLSLVIMENANSLYMINDRLSRGWEVVRIESDFYGCYSILLGHKEFNQN